MGVFDVLPVGGFQTDSGLAASPLGRISWIQSIAALAIEGGRGIARKVRIVFMDDSCTANQAEIEASVKLAGNSVASPDWLRSFVPPPYKPHRWLRGGHLQTLISPKPGDARPIPGVQSQRHRIDLADGDAMAIHDDMPKDWEPRRGSVLILHGICGCHAAGYMLRFRNRLNAIGIRTFRLDMRGCGDSGEWCQSITHAGRSEDVLSAIEFLGDLVDDPGSPIGGVGVSLGGNQLLLAAGRVGNGFHSKPRVWDRVGPILAIAPPLDLQASSDAMQALSFSFYNRYFIHHLLKRASEPLRRNPIYQNSLAQPKPRKLRQFDRTFTAPLGGFESEVHYYRESSPIHLVDQIQVPTMILTAADDPLVPIQSLSSLSHIVQSESNPIAPVRLLVTPTGGHHGYLQTDRTSWSDEFVAEFFDQGMSQ